ncbi:RluA family pseudouridine synthase [Gorillibacterium sp. sgz5001074]|uniref:RluA family pseudouridine synthase n=1 Tax=Gorillibacterium sp. sgz5001074 TaxID=3446695 RepID=UPI003F666D20
MTYYEPLTYLVPASEDGMELRAILQRRLHISRKLLSRLKLTEEGITVNGIRRYINYRVQAGDRVEVRMEEETSDDILPQDIPVDVLYEDDHLLIVNKPPGLIVHPTTGHWSNTLANGIVHMWQERGLKIRFRPIHRLDRETSGVLAVAKNPYVHQNVSEQMKAGTVEKEYEAVVHGIVERDAGTVDAPIDRNPDSPHYRIVTPSGYPSVTHYRVLERFRDATHLSLRLETGRTHQIRVHMSHIGHPLLGDAMYGPDASGDSGIPGVPGEFAPESGVSEWPRSSVPVPDRHALHAARLAFDHPVSRERMTFTAPLPGDIGMILSYLRNS